MTLPLIYVLNTCDKETKKELINIVKNKNEDSKFVKKAIELVAKNGGIEYAQKKMNELKNEALNCLINIPESPSKSAIIGLVEYTIQRTK